jgi:hypothetical protein
MKKLFLCLQDAADEFLDILTCIEMTFVSLVHYYLFDPEVRCCTYVF